MKALLALTSAKHSPGVTTAAVALAVAAGPVRPGMVVEADPAGGDIGARSGLPTGHGLASLATSGRHGGEIDLSAHIQTLPSGASALLAPAAPSACVGALDASGSRLVAALDAWDGLVVVDCGRWVSGGPARQMIGRADVLLVVLRPTLEGVEHVHARLDELRSAGAAALGALLVGDRPYPEQQVAAALGIPVVGVLPDDRRGANALHQRVVGSAMRRSALVRAARSALDRVAEWPSIKAGAGV